MARRAGIWFRKGTNCYYTTINGNKVRLSPDEKEAKRLFHELMAKQAETVEAQPEPVSALGKSFRKLADMYLVATKDQKIERVFLQQTDCLKAFCNHLKKKLPAKDLKPHHVRTWLDTKEWSAATKANKRKTIKAVLNWAVAEGYLDESPLKKMASGEGDARDRVLTADEKKRINEFVRGRSQDFADFLRAVELTGARPFSEMGAVTAKDVDFQEGTITLQRHKNRRKTGKPRTIYVVPEVMEILKARAERYPEGPLFRSRRGKTWYTGSSRKWFALIEEKLGIKAHAYLYRHSMITEALIRGVPVEVVAELVGNTVSVLHRHYSHVGKDQTALKAAALKAVTG